MLPDVPGRERPGGKTTEEVHQLGLKEVTRVRAEIRAELDKLGHKNPDMKAAFQEAMQASGIHNTSTTARPPPARPGACDRQLRRF